MLRIELFRPGPELRAAVGGRVVGHEERAGGQVKAAQSHVADGLVHEAGGRDVRVALDLLDDCHGVGEGGALLPGHRRTLAAHLLTHSYGLMAMQLFPLQTPVLVPLL